MLFGLPVGTLLFFLEAVIAGLTFIALVLEVVNSGLVWVAFPLSTDNLCRELSFLAFNLLMFLLILALFLVCNTECLCDWSSTGGLLELPAICSLCWFLESWLSAFVCLSFRVMSLEA